MSAHDTALSHLKFGVGQPVPRQEDPVLVRGEGRYTDDVAADGQLYAHFVRSPYAHGTIRAIDTDAARAMPGVVAIYTGHDLGAYGTLKCAIEMPGRDGTKMLMPKRPSLPTDKVRFVGDPVALVVAKTEEQARDAAEAVVLDIAM
ncbi:MAG: xanthine dehydrogenase family protein molybdopterin-binding subunit, partial [Beijerinckiaceae bacterium]|nr:xanthine dehydrogenase family protein molybdopterin-binding subunit [Beijerinckiaceae bacterium]